MININYLGSKRKFYKEICPIINTYIKENNITEFYDVFCGGAIIAEHIECNKVYANDLSPTLIALHKQAQTDFSRIPISQTRELFNHAREQFNIILKNLSDKKTLEDYQKLVDMPLYEIGAYEWYCSFSARGFGGGYGCLTKDRDLFAERRRNQLKQSQTEGYQKIIFTQGNYLNLEIPQNTLLYCDAPYRECKPYGISPHFNHTKYYDWLRKMSKTNPIFISEEQMPDDFPIIWTKNAKRTPNQYNKKEVIEKLYFIDNREI